jgi:hypothetical protein
LAGLRDWPPDRWWRATADPLGGTRTLLDVALLVPVVTMTTCPPEE